MSSEHTAKPPLRASSISSARKNPSPRDAEPDEKDLSGNIEMTDRHEPGISMSRHDDKVLPTLGEGPVAPVEAVANAVAVKKDLGYVEPGLKGWLNLLGVS